MADGAARGVPASVEYAVAGEFQQEGFFARVVELHGGLDGLAGLFEAAYFAASEAFVFDVLPDAQASCFVEAFSR